MQRRPPSAENASAVIIRRLTSVSTTVYREPMFFWVFVILVVGAIIVAITGHALI